MSIKEKFLKAKVTWIPCIAVFIVYCGLLFVEALFFGGNMRVGLLSLYAGVALNILFILVYFLIPGIKNEAIIILN